MRAMSPGAARSTRATCRATSIRAFSTISSFGLPEGELIIALPMPGRPMRGERRYHWVWFRAADRERELPLLCTDASGKCHGVTIPPPLIRAEVIAELKDHARAVLAPQLAALVLRTREPLLQPIYDLEVPRMAVGRVALVGDAAFVARPHAGTGVTKAAQDAECLADALAAAPTIDAALAAYDRARTAFGAALVARARQLGSYLEASAARRPTAPPRPETVLGEYGAAGTLAEEVYGAR